MPENALRVSRDADPRRRADTVAVPARDLSIPVLWSEEGCDSCAGRLDVDRDGVLLEGGPSQRRQTRAIPFCEIASVRVERGPGGRSVVIELRSGESLSVCAFERPGALHELAQRLQRSVSPGLA